MPGSVLVWWAVFCAVVLFLAIVIDRRKWRPCSLFLSLWIVAIAIAHVARASVDVLWYLAVGGFTVAVAGLFLWFIEAETQGR